MGSCRVGLVATAPERPCEDESGALRGCEQEPRDEEADLGYAGDERGEARQAAIGGLGLVSFGLLQAAANNWAFSLARKAAAAMTSVMCRCQPCQERASQ
jgi:hypothetical protein